MDKRVILLFDLDGTVIDSTEAILESFFVACEQNGCEKPSGDEVKKLIGYPLDVMFAQVGVDERKVWECVASYKEHYRVISKNKTLLLPRAKEAIELAATFARLGVVTTKTARYSKELLRHFGVFEFFEVLIGREDVQNPKPHPEPILRALEVMGKKPSRDVWMIGDTKLDLLCAKNAAVNAVGVLSGYGTNKELKRYGFSIKPDLYEAVTYLRQNEKN